MIGILLLSALMLQAPGTSGRLSFGERVFLGSIFVFLCTIGVSLCVRPNWMKRKVSQQDTVRANQGHDMRRCFIGHHPDCSVFDHHRITLGKKTWCAGCIGLLIGCLLSSGLMILYMFWVPVYAESVYPVLFFGGVLCIILVYAELFIGSRWPLMHIVLNSMLIVGFFFITISIAEHMGDVVDGFFTIVLCILWLDTRIMVSKWRHSLLCSSCPEPCKTFS